MQSAHARVLTRNELLVGSVGLAVLWNLSFQSYLLFHAVSEFFSIAVACGIFLVAVNTRAISQNGYLLFLGLGYAFVASVDMLHFLAFKGMGVFPGQDADLATQFWIIARAMQAFSLAAAPLFIGRAFLPRRVVLAYALATALLLASVYWGMFPVCFGPEGLTPFKKIAEYVISAILILSMVSLLRRKQDFSAPVLRMVVVSILLTIGSELAFTFYVSVYGRTNMVGHLLKIVAFYLIYKALVRTSLVDPYTMLFRDLAQSRKDLQKANDELEARVEDRTRELSAANAELVRRAGKLAESRASLADERQRLFYVLESLPAFVYLRGADYTVRFANRVFREKFGDPDGQPCHQLLWNREEPCEICPLERVLETGDPMRMQWNPAPDGRIYDLYDYPFTDTDGTPLVLEMGTDVTERERARNELVLHARRLEEANENLRDFAFVAAHDLQEPLRKVHTLADQVKMRLSGRIPEADQERLERLMAASARMRIMVGALLRFHQVAALEEPETVVDLNQVVSGVLSGFSSLLRERDARVEVGELPRVAGRAGKMRELFASLLHNALYYSGNGHPDITMEHRAVPAPESGGLSIPWHEIRVADKGPGFDMKYADKVFRPFQRLVSQGRDERLGMGLAVARRVVEMHRGRIWVESIPGEGTVFTVLLPGVKAEKGEKP
ncbi:MAG: MASE3 domain-containing protein [Pseudomonadota bacterium]